MKSVLHLKQTLFLKKEEGKGGKKANQLNLKIRRNCHEWNFKQEFMVRWQVHSRDYKSPRPVLLWSPRLIMNSSTASIQPLQMRGGDRDRGKGLILRSFSPRNMDSLCTRHVVSEGTYFRAVPFSLSFLKRKRDRVMIYRRDGTDPSPLLPLK